jgi:hypothetical protein
MRIFHIKRLILISFGILLLPFFAYNQVRGNELTINTTGNQSDTKSIASEPCESHLEEGKVVSLMDTITAVIHVDFYCSCGDNPAGAQVKLSNKERTYERITDRSGCDFRHIRPGSYRLEVICETAEKFESVEVMVMSGAIARWKVFLCGK